MTTKFVLDGTILLSRYNTDVPRINERVQLITKSYRVIDIVWDFDTNAVNIHLTPYIDE